MTQACCHFLYPIVLNPWCMSISFIRDDGHADIVSAALPVLDLHYTVCDLILYAFVYHHRPFLTRASATFELSLLLLSRVAQRSTLTLHSTIHPGKAQWQRHHPKDHQVMHTHIHTRLSQDSPVSGLHQG